MIKTLALENFWPVSFAKTKKINVKRAEANPWRFWLALALIATNAAFLMSYIYGVNENASRGYEITQLQKQLADLNTQNKTITLKISEATSMVSIQSDFLSANFVPAGTPKFLQTGQYAQIQNPSQQLTQVSYQKQYP